jgi:Tol biopolymer transport system component
MTAVDALGRIPFDWSADARELLVSQDNEITHREEVWILPLAAAPHAELKGRKLLADLGYSFYQPHFSPNGHWIVFEAVRVTPTRTESTLYVIPAEGGAWKRVTSGLHWDDKPRWSPDGKIIYFVSRKGGVFNVWGIRFDPESGNVSGEPFRITPFRQSSLRIADHIHNVGLSVTQDQLVVTTKEESGNIWVLDGVD